MDRFNEYVVNKIKREEIDIRRKRVEELFLDGYSLKEIAFELDWHYMTIYDDFKSLEMDVNARKSKMTARQEKVKRLYKEGHSCREIATKLIYSYGTIHQDLKTLGLVSKRNQQKI